MTSSKDDFVEEDSRAERQGSGAWIWSLEVVDAEGGVSSYSSSLQSSIDKGKITRKAVFKEMLEGSVFMFC